MSNKYTILSIGPIYSTMQLADNTRAIWTVSFMFSYLMKETIKELMKVHKKNFLVPTIDNDFKKYLEDKQHIGIFHDRLIIKGDVASDVNKAFYEALEELAEIVVDVFSRTQEENYKYVQLNFDANEVRAFIKNYFQSYIATTEINSGNPIIELSKYVDAIEYQPQLAPFEEKEYLYLFFRLTNLGLLQDIAFGDDAQKVTKLRCFPSVAEISAWELIKDDIDRWKKEHLCLKIDDAQRLKDRIKNPNDETDEIFKVLQKEKGEALKPYHKYIAIVHGDGDGFGKYLNKIGNDTDKIVAFSKNVFNFITAARDKIEEYGGFTVVGSGEDLLFFAPVINDEKNIFTLINEIDDVFKTSFNDPDLTMSYGISITYYKYPIKEALELSGKALWEHAKKAIWVNRTQNLSSIDKDLLKNLPSKNAVHIEIKKHSGQSHALTLRKDTVLYQNFIKLLNKELDKKDSLHLPHALHHSLSRVEKVINIMPKENIEHFFTNMFNENIHKVKHKEALQSIQNILAELKKEASEEIYRLKEGKNGYYIDKPSNVIFSILSTIKMLRGDE